MLIQISRTVSFWQGVNKDVVFVFSCPGKEEKNTKKLVSGTTGKNLNILLKIMHENIKVNSIFKSEDRYQYTITNVSDIIHYKERDNRTEPTYAEICLKENRDRLFNEVSKYKIDSTATTLK